MEGVLTVPTGRPIQPPNRKISAVSAFGPLRHVKHGFALGPKTRPPTFGLASLKRAPAVARMNARPACQRVGATLRHSARRALPLGKSRRSAYADTARRGWAFPLTPLPSSPRQRKALARLDFLCLAIMVTMESSRTDNDKSRLPIHRRVDDPPRMQLTRRDRQVIHAVYKHRFLRRNQIQALFFPSRNTANRRLQGLFQHGFLKRLLPPVQLGEGREQAIYALDERGADLIAAEKGVAREDVRWRKKDNKASFLFLDHSLHINDFRIAIALAANARGYRIARWLDEREIKSLRERVPAPGKQRRCLPVTPDAFFEVDLGDRRAGFFLEMDMGTMTNKRFKDKVRAYIIYKTQGYYQKKFGIASLRVLTVTTSHRRLRNLKRATERVSGQSLFWFTTFKALSGERITHQVWQIASQEGSVTLFKEG
jgi:hypothetical protein